MTGHSIEGVYKVLRSLPQVGRDAITTKVATRPVRVGFGICLYQTPSLASQLFTVRTISWSKTKQRPVEHSRPIPATVR